MPQRHGTENAATENAATPRRCGILKIRPRRALRVVFSVVSKSTLLITNRLNAVLGPLLGGPDCGLRQ
jgi:hypothetical protein